MRYKNLFQPIKIKSLVLKNRLVMAPMSTQFASPGGSVTEELIDFLEERAKGGVGMIITGYTFIDGKFSKASVNQLGSHSDAMVPRLNALVETTRPYGTRIFLQLCHAGRQTDKNIIGGIPVGPSPMVDEEGAEVTRELTREEIEEIIEMFGLAAKRAKQAGFDGVEIHGAHGYLINQFMSDYTNRRTDEYGGDISGRMRFALKVLGRTREYVGEDYPVGFRINGTDYLEFKEEKLKGRGMTLAKAKEAAKILEKNGVDYLHVSAGIGETGENACQPMYFSQGYNVYLAEAIKREVDVPVITVGSITDPDMAEQIISQEKADLVALGRALIADPHFSDKARSDREEEILRCIRCNECSYRTSSLRELRCSVNPRVGRERRFVFTQSKEKKRVVVVGGGPAGMEAARVSALKGHEVILVEKEEELGGKLLPASFPSFKKDLKNLIDYYLRKMEHPNIEVFLNQEASLETIEGLNPQVLILATGAEPILPDIPGVSSGSVFSCLDVLTGRANLKGDKFVVVGGGSIGCEVAIFLTEPGKDVTIVEALDEILLDQYDVSMKRGLIRKLREASVKTITGCSIQRMTGEGLFIKKDKGKSRFIEADNIILATGFVSKKELYEESKDRFDAVYCVGDCAQPRKIIDAIQEAALIANSI